VLIARIATGDAAAPKQVRPLRYKQPKALEGSPISNRGVTIEMADARNLATRR
jgi:hypothetical protein